MLRRLLGYLAPHGLTMLAVVGTILAAAAIELLAPWPLKVVVDNVIGQQPALGFRLEASLRAVVLVVAALAYVLLAAGRGGIALYNGRWLSEVTQRTSLALRSDLYAQVQRLSLRFHDRARVGDVVSRVTTDVDELQEAFVTGVSELAGDLLTVLGIAAVMFLVDRRFALVACVILPPLFLVYVRFRRRIRDASREVRQGEGVMASLAQETLSSIRVVKAFGQEDREHDRFLRQTRSKVEASIRAATWEGLFSLWVEIATAAGMAIVMGYGAWRVVDGALTVGELLLFLQYLTSLFGPVRRLSRLTRVAQKAAASAERIADLFAQDAEVRESTAAVTLTRARGAIGFDGVWFGYQPDRPLLRGVELRIDPGEIVALVGASGVGKSTLVNLIPRFYDVSWGRLTVDGSDVRDLRLRSLRNQISVVPQDTFLFSGTIRDNIAYGRPEASEADLIAAARAAHAHEFIVDLPGAYDTPVGERGLTLSGGQRQRIAIARALLKDAPILILDEPTSSVDTESEVLVLDALARLARGRTTIVISHRLVTTGFAERVLALAHGKIVDIGTPAELPRTGGFVPRVHPQQEAPPVPLIRSSTVPTG